MHKSNHILVNKPLHLHCFFNINNLYFVPFSCSVAFSLNFRRSSPGPFSGTTGGNKGYVEFDFYRFLFSILDTTMEESLRVREGHLKGFIMYSLGEVMHAIVLFGSFCVTDHLPLP